MKVRKTKVLSAAIVSSMLLSALNVAFADEPRSPQAEITLPATFGTLPESIKRIPPPFPAGRHNQRGWVELEFTVDENGGARNPAVIDSEPRNVFDKDSEKIFKKWRFTPATEQGVPVSWKLDTRFTFYTFNGPPKEDPIDEKISNAVEEAEAALASGDLANARERVEYLKRKAVSAPELAATSLVSSRLAQREGDTDEAIGEMESAVSIADYHYKPEYVYQLRLILVMMQIDDKRYANALQSLQKLKEKAPDQITEENKALTSKMTAFLDGSSLISNTRKLKHECTSCAEDERQWVQSLYRNGIRVKGPEGAVSKIRIICGQNWWDFTPSQITLIQVPAEPQSCEAHIRGQQNSTITIEEVWLQ